jgi:hypothetical protein
MYPRLKSWAFPHDGVSAHDSTPRRRVARQRSAGGDCSVSSGVLSPGCIRRGVGVWKRTFRSNWADRLTHTALILGELERGRFTHGEPVSERRRQSFPSFGSLPGRSVRGHTTLARLLDPVWVQHTITTRSGRHNNCTDPKPPTGHSAVVRSASDALPPTAEAVGFRAIQR